MPCHTVCMDPVPPGHPHCPCVSNDEFSHAEAFRTGWERWDLRVLSTYILYTQLYLLFFGRRRRKSASHFFGKMNVWILYLLVELLAVITLGKLSNATAPYLVMRGLWAPITFFYLGGPDTITVLRLEENDMWIRHLIGLFAQGFRTAYVLYATWSKTSELSLLALLMLLSGVIKYGERVWVIRSRVQVKNLQHQECGSSDKSTKFPPPIACTSDEELVFEAYYYFETLLPHNSSYSCDRVTHIELLHRFQEWVKKQEEFLVHHNTFKLVEIELGFAYDKLFSKVDTIFTIWGFILRLISFSCIVAVFVVFLLVNNYPAHLFGDVPVTIVLLAGAILLEIGGVLVQLSSDWAIVWAHKHHGKMVRPIFHLHKLVNWKSKRWSNLMGQFNLLEICNKEDSDTKFQKLVDTICGWEVMLSMKYDIPPEEVQPQLKKLIFDQLFKRFNVSDVETLVNSRMTRGARSLEEYDHEQLKWSTDELEFSESITIWHIATDICHNLEQDKSAEKRDKIAASKILSSYMMHLLFKCPYSLPIHHTYDGFWKVKSDLKKLFEESKFKVSIVQARKLLKDQSNTGNRTIDMIKKLTNDLNAREDKWDIMSNVWIEMLCYAASNCPVKNHVQELKNGGQLLTHVWLLLLHFGGRKRLEKYASQGLGGVADLAFKEVLEIL